MSESLEVTKRTATGSHESRRLRRSGMVPAVLYGHGKASVELSMKRESLVAVLRHGSRVVELKGAVKASALVRELQWDTFGTEPLHVDFVRVDASELIHVKVPIDMRGECPGQKAGGIVSLVLHEIDVECTAASIPDHIHALLGSLTLGGSIKVHDLQTPAGVRFLTDADETVVTCAAPQDKADAEAASGTAEPEIIGRKPDEEEPPAAT
ncbi:MAG: 50S ribosomal protein L25 [Planctomycetota bacterium]|jgi:large subunit ribosomal protein L25|nr:50S ribosomal protein L25 [Planctomycetia bacterium]MDO7677587.1 50S ribosomal protein L25 [Pirellulales bacterium]RLS29678.1 MAG: 50S ribosomal protein L25 [Planctomycetota bacterium]TSA08601.1 MAG: 50S ribosomal protein L25 [Planctomycetaceae bacterium]